MLRDFLDWVIAQGGADHVQTAFEELPEEQREWVDLERPGCGLVASHWYPTDFGSRLTERYFAAMTMPERRQALRDVARYVADESLKGVQKILFHLLPDLRKRGNLSEVADAPAHGAPCVRRRRECGSAS